MGGFLRGLIWGLILVGGGWIGGSLFPAPAAITAPIAERAPNLAARLGISDVSLERLRAFMSEEQLSRLQREASDLAARAGQAIAVERDDEALQEILASFEGYAAAPNASPVPVITEPQTDPDAIAGAEAFETELSLCPGMTVSNAPPTDGERRVRDFSRVVDVEGVAIAVNPTRGACLSSAFGPRGRGLHKGLDYYSNVGGPIFAGGAGVVVERKYRDDYGNMLLIDHGDGVFTRYAHLSSFADGVLVGAEVSAGQQLGLMGNTASYQIPIHLHYELLIGDYDTPRGSFGLEPRSPFDYPTAE